MVLPQVLGAARKLAEGSADYKGAVTMTRQAEDGKARITVAWSYSFASEECIR
jgi:hypothetical protein